MRKAWALAGLFTLAAGGWSAKAESYLEYPAPTPYYPFQRSFLTGEAVAIPPYPYPFPVRVYTTPSQQPYYNVPPYAVIAPY